MIRLLGDGRHFTSVLEIRKRILGRKRKLFLVGGGVAAAVFSISLVFFTDAYFFFMNQQQITINGRFVQCVPNSILDICHPGFLSNEGRYFLLTNLQEILEENADIRQELDESSVTSRQFQVIGTFSYGVSQESAGFEAVGMIEASSVVPTD